ncbi:1-deoxy-D-xylulose-5-phosphate reductoisomerase [Candidatus Pelagibacter sp. HIMB1611]|uniref:1-deoxy-D-xylulose-5-phosphate reductoisomerase n=1 Tax=unclassified Candidatus Pelagibacter TaxID=2647897 RepID=UPI003F82A931
MKIAILGSTGSIGNTLLKIIKKNESKIKVVLLTAHKNHKKLLHNAKKFNVKNLIITNPKSFKILKEKTKTLKINVYNDYENLDKIFNKKIDYTMSSIIGLSGLEPTLKIIKHTKKIAIANKESIICGWNLISKELRKFKTKFIPVDSEHFSIWYGLINNNVKKILRIYLTASGGSVRKIPINKINGLKIKQFLKHPNWQMGKKITIDSATMMNKLFEVIEARNIFNIGYENIKIIVHPSSYVHAILEYNDGLIKIIAHDTTMEIPIFNSIFNNKNIKFNSNKINFNLLNNLNFTDLDLKRYPAIKLLKKIPKKFSLFDTILVSANDYLVELFLNKKILFYEIYYFINYIINLKELQKFKRIKPSSTEDIMRLNKYVHLKLKEKCV